MNINGKVANRILDAIFDYIPDHFGLIDGEDYPDGIEALDQALEEIDSKAWITCGASKLVIYAPSMSKDMVMKIPFKGCFYYLDSSDEDEDDDSIEYSGWGAPIDWYEFQGASGDDCSDYCLAEYQNYLKLKEMHLECFAAKTYFYKTVNGFRIFFQEKVIAKNCDSASRKPSFKSQEIAASLKHNYSFYFNSEWTANCVDLYGVKKVERFISEIDQIDPGIMEDMHSGNFGYRSNGTPCLLDFSGYSS